MQLISSNIILFLEIVKFLLNLARVSLSQLFVRLVIKADQIFACNVKSIQVVHCILCIINVLVHDESRPFCLPCRTSNKESMSNYLYFLIYLSAPYLPKISQSSSGVILKGRFLTNIILFTSGGRRIYIYQLWYKAYIVPHFCVHFIIIIYCFISEKNRLSQRH